MVRNITTRRAGGSETTVASQSWSQPGNREAVLRGLRGVPKESRVPPNVATLFELYSTQEAPHNMTL